MNRKLGAGKLVLASHNRGKAKEINELLAGDGSYEFVIISAADLGLAEPDEIERTFIGNARLKALAAARESGLPSLADDSGLEVAALNGAPGIYSARWARPSNSFADAMARVERELNALRATDFSARFVSALSLAWPDGHDETFEGEIRGKLTFPPRGDLGFGYDPIFIANGETQTFGEMDPTKKNLMSHRADAFRRLRKACLD